MTPIPGARAYFIAQKTAQFGFQAKITQSTTTFDTFIARTCSLWEKCSILSGQRSAVASFPLSKKLRTMGTPEVAQSLKIEQSLVHQNPFIKSRDI